jgi:hypothetical protein
MALRYQTVSENQMTQTQLANAADYAEALLTARRAKALITLLVLLVLLTELALFFCLRYYRPLAAGASSSERYSRDVMQYCVGLLDFCGLILPALLAVVIYLILKVQLVGRLVGVGRMTQAFLWSVVLMLLLFPWQAVLNNPAIDYNRTDNLLGMKIPGVIYTWAEVSNPALGAGFAMGETKPEIEFLILKWARYVAFPVLSILILAVIHLKSERGVRQSLGESEVIVTTNPVV